MAHLINKLLQAGIQANQDTPYRIGNIIELPAHGDLIITGDLHGHVRNFERIVNFAQLENQPDRHVILHEIIHGGPQTPSGGCLSYQVLAQAIEWKLQFPHQVHFILGNHDTAYISGAEVMKDGREMNKALDRALVEEFGEHSTEIQHDLRQFLLSQAMGVHTTTRLWFSHSLPADRLVDQFDPTIFSRPLTPSDCVKPGSAYILTWGRRMSQGLLNRLRDVLNADLFIAGHQPQTEGWAKAGDNLLILASDHNHGCLIQLDLDRPYSLEQAEQLIIPLSSIA